jgi:hypothetical protein
LLLSVIGAVQYGPSQVFSQIVPHVDTEARRQYLPQVMPILRKTAQEVVMVVDRRGIHRTTELASTLAQ